MINRDDSRLRVKGVVHCHTEMSYDSSISLELLCRTLKEEGFSFVAVTDHVKGITAGQYRSFVDTCKKMSSDQFVVIPGLEILLDNGDEIAAVGIHEFISSTASLEVFEQIHQQGGYSIWVHPHKRRRPALTKYDCNAIEILNGKIDGTVAPNLELFFQTRKLQRMGRNFHVIFGADLHNLNEDRSVWIECEVFLLTEDDLLCSLRHGLYENHVTSVNVSSYSFLSLSAIGRMVLFRLAYLAWNTILERLPNKYRFKLVLISRDLVKYLKGFR